MKKQEPGRNNKWQKPTCPTPEDPRKKMDKAELINHLNNQAINFLEIHLSELAESVATESREQTIDYLFKKMNWYMDSTMRIFNVLVSTDEFDQLIANAIDQAMTQAYQQPVHHLHRGEILHQKAVQQETKDRIIHRQDRLIAVGKEAFIQNLSSGTEYARQQAELAMRNAASQEMLYGPDEQAKLDYEIGVFVRHFVAQLEQGDIQAVPQNTDQEPQVSQSQDPQPDNVIRPIFGRKSPDKPPTHED